MDKVNVIVLAGESKKRIDGQKSNNKAFIDINGKWMVEYVLEALWDCPLINKICVVGPVDKLRNRFGDRIDYYFEAGENLFDNVSLGIEPFRDDEHVMVVTSDILMINGHIVADLIKRCKEQPADLCYPIVDREVNEYKYPGFQRTYVKLKEGVFTGGNIIFFNPKIVKPCQEFVRKVIQYRKKPWKISGLLGLKFMIMLLMGKLTIPLIQERISNILNITAVAVISPYPELANDVDRAVDIEMVYRHFLGTDVQL